MIKINKEYNFRTLNYLGSKLRLLDFIEESIANVTPIGFGVCDLFAGSGCVSYKLSRRFPIISSDIQGYSKVLCDALLRECSISTEEINNLISVFKTEHARKLESAFDEIINIEEKAIKNKDIELLTSILEYGSTEITRLEKNESNIYQNLLKVSKELADKDLINNKSLISRYYGGVYFSYRQAVDIDILLEAIHQIYDNDKKNVFLAALLSTASDIVNTVGKHFAQPIKARDTNGKIKSNIVYNKAIKDKTIKVLPLYMEWLNRYIFLPRSNYSHYAAKSDYLESLKNLPNNVKTIYADPPYTRDHYSRFYHVLETMTLRDSPDISTVKIHGETHFSNGIYRKDRHQSPFCIRSQAPKAFRQMFQIAASTGRNILLSYSPYDETKKTHPRVVTMQQLIDLAKEYFTNVKIKSAGYFVHNKLNSTKHFLEASEEAEVLIICTNDNINISDD